MKGIELAYKSDQHKKLLTAITTRYDLSYRLMSNRYRDYAKADEQFIAYLPETEVNSKKRVLRESGTPQYTTLEIPYSYAVLMTIHTYLSSVLLARAPILQFQGRHGESEDQCAAMEALIDYQVQVGEMLVPLYIWIMDSLKYGLGVLGTYWTEEKVRIARLVEQQPTFLGIPTGKAKKVRIVEDIPGYVGNKVFNVRPQDFFPDPRVPIWRLQQGEFCARRVEVGYNTLLRGKAEGLYNNLEHITARSSFGDNVIGSSGNVQRDTGSSQITLPSGDVADDMDKGFHEILEFHWELVPSDWGLGEGKLPEKWVFAVANQKVIISAQPYGMYHNKFPFNTFEPDLNGYGFANRGLLEVVKPLTDTLSWLVNTHFYNVRRTLNNELLIDPSMFEMQDFMQPGPGKLIRAKPAAYGKDIRMGYAQLNMHDITRSHIGDIGIITDLIQRVLGVNDNVMGMVNTGGRKSATEVRSSSSFAVNRMKTLAEFQSAQSLTPWAQMLVQNTQQMYDQEQIYRRTGDLTDVNRLPLKVTPDLIIGFFDFVPIDGTMPIDRVALANVWRELMVQAARLPQVMQQYDLSKIFAYVARMSGAKNIDQFKIKVSPDAALMGQAQAGNVVPLGGNSGPTGQAPATFRAGADGARLPGAARIAGMGPTE
ncbi:MAG: portal protein [Minisyncoccota bacterium]